MEFHHHVCCGTRETGRQSEASDTHLISKPLPAAYCGSPASGLNHMQWLVSCQLPV